MYYEAMILLRYETDQPMNEDTVRAYLQGHSIETRPCEFAILRLEEANPQAEWVRDRQRMNIMAVTANHVLSD